jgi:hypothetical protein
VRFCLFTIFQFMNNKVVWRNNSKAWADLMCVKYSHIVTSMLATLSIGIACNITKPNTNSSLSFEHFKPTLVYGYNLGTQVKIHSQLLCSSIPILILLPYIEVSIYIYWFNTSSHSIAWHDHVYILIVDFVVVVLGNSFL